LAAPNADFPQIVMHPFFSPITDSEAKKFATTTGWGFEGVTIGNGPFKLKSAGAPDSGTVVIERNDKWGGSILGDKKAALDTITFKISANVQGSYQAFESGEGDSATIPSGQFKTAMASHKNTVAEGQLGTYYFDFGFADPQLGGKKNTKLRQAISMAIDRNEINNKVYEGTRVISTGITPPGIPGFKADLCKYCKTDEVAAKKLFDEWTAAGGKLTAPIKLSFNVTGGHDVVAQIIQSNLKRVLGIDAELNPIETGYFGAIAEEGACQLCRAGWLADYPTYGNFMVDLFGKASIDQNNLGRYNDPEFEKLVAAAQKEPDTTKRAELYQKAEDHLLNVTTGAIPLNWYTGDEVYSDKLVNFSQPPLGLILWEKVGKK
jgi:ABC-type oligopeptide transport system substrate-binding subunit